MKRKVIQLAGKTLVISLPVKWARMHNILKGDELELTLGNNQLSISTQNKKVESKISLFLDCTSEFAKRRINTLYKRGIDEINLSVKKPALLCEIQKSLNSLMGFEIIDRFERSCIIKNIAQPIDENLNILVKRVFLINLEMTKLIEQLLQKKEKEVLDELKTLEELNDKLTNTCKRVLNKQVNQEMDKVNLTYCLLWGLEKVGDEYEQLGVQIYNSKITSNVLKIIAKINEFHRSFYDLYCKFDEQKASNFSLEYKQLKLETTNLLLKNHLLGHHAFNIVQSVYDLAGPYYAMIL